MSEQRFVVMYESSDDTYLHGIVLVPRHLTEEAIKELIDDAYDEATNLHEWSYNDIHRTLRQQGLTVINDYFEWREPK